MKRTPLQLALLCAVMCAVPPAVYSESSTSSAPYEANWQVYSSGGKAVNGSYQVVQAIGQTAAGWTYPVGNRLNSGFVQQFSKSACCSALTGNVDCDLGDGIDISDLSALIDFLYISFTPLCCPGEANIDGDLLDGIDISDLSGLIDYLYISFTPTAVCQ